MKISKIERQTRLLKIIEERLVETQQELVDSLAKSGMNVTQATISRDIKELGIIKIVRPDGIQHYGLYELAHEAGMSRMMHIFAASVRNISTAQNIVVILTLPAMASGAAATLDSLELPDMVGSLAGDDTIFLACRSNESAKRIMNSLQSYLHEGYVL